MADRKMIFSKTKTANSILKQLGVTAAMLMASTNANALGLGALEVLSNLEQPLNGTIELRTAPSDDLSSVNARIASREDFESLGIDYPTYMQNISLALEEGGSGQVLRVRSDQVVINEPFIHFLIRVDWSGGSFLREYTALIDPPVYAAEAPRSISEPRSVGTDQSYAQEAAPAIVAEPLNDTADTPYEDIIVSDPPIEEVAAEDAPLIDDNFYEEPQPVEDTVDSGVDSSNVSSTADSNVPQGTDARYGPVTSGESLSLIAQELQRQFPDLSIYSIMKVLFEENESAFIGNNINGLMAGAILDIGDLNAIRAVDAQQAKVFFSSQVAEWDPGVLAPRSADSISVGQDEYSFNNDAFGSADTGSSATTASADNFQVGASRDTAEFVSSDQGASREGEVLALRQEISQLETSLTSSELENQELSERISSLEGQLADMNRLMSLDVESAELAAVEQSLAQQNDVSSDVTADSVVDEFLADSSVDDEFGLSDAPDSLSTVDDFLSDDAGEIVDTTGESAVDEFLASVDETADQSVSATQDGFESVIEDVSADLDSLAEDEDTVAAAPVIQPVKTESFIDKATSFFFNNGLWVALAAFALALLGGLGVLFARRRKVDEEFEISMLSIESNSQSIDTLRSESNSLSTSMSASVASVAESVADKETSFLTVYSDSDAVVQADEVDPVAEADVYIAYGRDEQAEEVLLDGIANHPDRVDIKQKILGLYQKTKNVEGFERVAEELYSQREALTPELWEEVSVMGRELSPDNPLFSLSVDDISTAAGSSMSFDTGAEAESLAGAAADGESDALQPEVSDKPAEKSAQQGLEGHSELVEESLSDDDEIQLIDFDDGRSEVSEFDEVDINAISLDDEPTDIIEFSSSALDESAELDKDVIEVASGNDDGDLLSFDLDEGESDTDDFDNQINEIREVSDMEIDPDYDESRTQYELAKVFVDLGDEDGARKILKELVDNAELDESVISDARELLESITS